MNRTRFMYKYFSIIFLLTSFLGYSQADYSIVSVPVDLVKNSNSVLIDELVEIDVSDSKSLVYTSHRAVTVYNEKGDKNAFASVGYDNDRKVKEAEVWVYDILGNEIQHYKKRDFKDVSSTGGSLYEDDRLLYLDYTPVSYPYTLVFDYKVVSASNAFIKPWFVVNSYATGTKKSVYKLTFDPLNKPRYKAENLEGHNIVLTEKPNEITIEAMNFEAFRYENHSPKFKSIVPNVRFSLSRFYLNGSFARVENWKDFGIWMQNSLLSDVNELPQGTVNMVKNLVKDETTDLGKARKIYEYLQNKVRYISVQVGIGGLKPMLASEVDKLSYGDCKALTNYTKALLDVVGVPSYYTILYSDNNGGDITKNFTSIEGDHVILGIPSGDDIVWLECTSQDLPFGFGGDFSDDRDVLILTPEGGKIVHTRKYSFEENYQENRGSIELQENGGIVADLQVNSKALQYDNKYMLEKETRADLIEYYKERWSYINGLDVESMQFTDNKKDIVFTENLHLVASNYSSKIGEDLLFCINVFNQNQYIPPRISDRKQDLFISSGYKDVDHFEIVLPEGFSFESLPEAKLIENIFGSYSISFSEIADNKIIYHREIILKKGTFPPEQYVKYRAFRKKVAKLDKTKILLKSKKS